MHQTVALPGSTPGIALQTDERRRLAARRSGPALWLLMTASWLGMPATVGADEKEFARVCAERDLGIVTLVEGHGEAALGASFVGHESLYRATLMLIEAREECDGGRVGEAIALYDKIVAILGPVSAHRNQ